MDTLDGERVLDYWNREDVESMYDKHLLNAEIEMIRGRISTNSKILDAGCGEGEGTLIYSDIPGVTIHGVDFSETRLQKARVRLSQKNNVKLEKVDLLNNNDLERDYDFIVSQRFLINLTEWQLQCRILLELMSHLRPGGKLIMLEGSKQGVEKLNQMRELLNLEPIPVKWHNLFFDDTLLVEFMKKSDYQLVDEDDLGPYFLLTRGIRPALDRSVDWDCEFNKNAADRKVGELLSCCSSFSRLKLWMFRK